MSTAHPPIKSDYTPKGSYKTYGGFNKVYVTGPAKPSNLALVCVYDIFGFKPQTQQGADILAEKLNAHIVMPDFFEPGAPWPADKFPPQTDEEKANLHVFFGGAANPKNGVMKLVTVSKALKDDGAKFVGAFGFCWRGKATILAGSQADTPLDAIAAVHPAMLSSADTKELKVPLGLYPSKDKPQEEYKKIVEIVSKNSFAAKNDHKFYDTFHGFAAARANLDDPKNKADFEDLCATLIKFFTNASAQ
ncbi:hypothetical protein WOLCODRAFT_141584 [Wolfiporia cocos MD-104 SS10]|uniref:Dienelactone hydrolase domain-containing protein n=1 Tax=Wolfiporia cocos (strain MD-104) TaxID=742152 RepID=A0A2H3J0H0_WOLCO|nr:hypothetical protein WOLCODRAFT_141584 [Wolfiporia cocos MD-104 SS10]